MDQSASTPADATQGGVDRPVECAMDPVEAAESAGRMAEALGVHERLSGLFADLFIEVNPVPVKAAMAMMGLIEEVYRLPLCELAPENHEKLRLTLRKLDLV